MLPHNFGLSVSPSYAAFVGTVMLRQEKSFRLNHPKKIPIFAISTYTILRKGGAGMKKTSHNTKTINYKN